MQDPRLAASPNTTPSADSGAASAILVFISGSLAGTTLPIGPDDLTIGRDSTHRSAASDLALSRRHCTIALVNGVVTLTDLESRNGTFVNGAPVRRCTLRNGDEVRAGASVMVVVTRDDRDEGSAAPRVALDSRPSQYGTTILLRPEASLYAPDRRAPGSHVDRQRLAALLAVSQALYASESVDALALALVDHLASALAPGRGALVLADADSPAGLTVHAGTGADAFAVDETVVRDVMSNGTAALLGEARGLPAGAPAARARAASSGSAESAEATALPERGAAQVSIMCAPLSVSQRSLGALYLVRHDPAPAFVEDDLQYAAGAARIAALALEQAQRREAVEREARRLRDEAAVAYNMIGDSEAIGRVRRFIARAAPSESTVLLCGESGAGKELIARAIHDASPRSRGPFIAINCAALTETLLESELFGHEKGSFTGAVAQKRGKMEVADGGTLFLDEVGELAPVVQAKLLRALQESTFERIGGLRPIKVSVRIIAATNADLDAGIQTGAFRRDLFYRLNVVSLTAPPLRERREDIPLLAAYFHRKFADACKRKANGISPEARRRLLAYSWPGNVRELQNTIERAVVLGAGESIELEDLPEAILETVDAAGDQPFYHDEVNDAKRRIILKALTAADGRVIEAARSLGLQPTYLHRLVSNLGLRDAVKRR